MLCSLAAARSGLAAARSGLAAALTLVPIAQGWLACVALAISVCIIAVGRINHCPDCLGLWLSPAGQVVAAVAAFCTHRGLRRREAAALRAAKWLNLLCVPVLLLAALLLCRWRRVLPADCRTPALSLATLAALGAMCCICSARAAHIVQNRGTLGYGMLLGRCTPLWGKRCGSLRWNHRRHSWSECPPLESITCLSPVIESPRGEGLDMLEFRL